MSGGPENLKKSKAKKNREIKYQINFTNNFFDQMPYDEIFSRRNWSIHDNPSLRQDGTKKEEKRGEIENTPGYNSSGRFLGWAEGGRAGRVTPKLITRDI